MSPELRQARIVRPFGAIFTRTVSKTTPPWLLFAHSIAQKSTSCLEI